LLPEKHFPIWLKLALTLYVLVFIPVYWVIQGPANFLWLCDVALFLAVVALWSESPIPAGMVAIGSLLPELIWNMDVLFRLLTGRHLFELDATAYMFLPTTPPAIRALSLFHVFLPFLGAWMVYRLGYDRRAFGAQVIIGWIVLPMSYWFSPPTANINWVFGPGKAELAGVSPQIFTLILMLSLPLLVYLPTHLLLRHCFPTHP
jgi:hypothetical protein